MKKVKVAVLISTYNGSLYLKSQLDSVLAQYGLFELSVFIRDDGSNDETCLILQEYCEANSNITIFLGDNLGVVGSFLWLVENIEGHDYYAFCDQDDVWHPLKIQAALFTMSDADPARPSIYCSSYDYVNKELKLLGRGSSASNLQLNNLLVENCATGCTVVFNDALIMQCRVIPLSDIPDQLVMHDWFVVLVGCLLGDVYYDLNSYISYRQHDNNVVGANYGFFKPLINKAKRIINQKDKKQLILQAELILKYFQKSMNDEDRKLIRAFLKSENIFTRIGFLLNYKVHRNKLIDNYLFKFLFVIGYYK